MKKKKGNIASRETEQGTTDPESEAKGGLFTRVPDF